MKTSRASEQEKFLKHCPGETEENREVRLSSGWHLNPVRPGYEAAVLLTWLRCATGLFPKWATFSPDGTRGFFFVCL